MTHAISSIRSSSTIPHPPESEVLSPSGYGRPISIGKGATLEVGLGKFSSCEPVFHFKINDPLSSGVLPSVELVAARVWKGGRAAGDTTFRIQPNLSAPRNGSPVRNLPVSSRLLANLHPTADAFEFLVTVNGVSKYYYAQAGAIPVEQPR